MKNLTAAVVTAAFSMLAGNASANLIPIGPIPTTGNGLGAVNTSLTFQNTGTESGCVSYSGTTTVVGVCPTGFAGGNEGNTSVQDQVYTPAQLGFSSTNDFRNLVLIFNGNEGGNTADQPITLTALGLTLYSSSGVPLMTFTDTTLGVNGTTYPAFPGTGVAGFAFALDSTEAAQANAFLASNPTLRIGTEATATNAQGGPETISLSTVTSTGVGGGGQVPEPGTIFLLGSGLILVGGAFRRKRTV